MLFTVYEAKESCRTRQYRYEVEANSAEQALEVIDSSDCPDPTEEGYYDGEDWGSTGRYVATAEDHPPCWQEAMAALVEVL